MLFCRRNEPNRGNKFGFFFVEIVEFLGNTLTLTHLFSSLAATKSPTTIFKVYGEKDLLQSKVLSSE